MKNIDDTSKRRLIHVLISIVLIAILFVIDRETKAVAMEHFGENPAPVSIIDGVLELVLVFNTGSAWSMFAGKLNFLMVITLICLVVILFAYFKLPFKKKYDILHVLLAIIVAGALGNMYDRVFFHKVTDFIYFKLIDFPVFNVADIYVTVSAFFIVVLMLTKYKNDELMMDKEKKEEKEEKEKKEETKENQ